MTQDTAPHDADIDDRDDDGGGRFLQWLGLLGSILGAVMGSGAIVGFVSASQREHPGLFHLRDVLIGGGLILFTLGLLYLAWRISRRLYGNHSQIPTREKRSRNMLIASLGLGVAIGVILSVAGLVSGAEDPLSLLSDSPIPPLVAVALSLILLVVLPMMSWRWLRAIDEHERESYRDGALVASYAFLTLAPVWWLLWRGGLMPAPDGIILYFAFNLIFLAVWFWKNTADPP